MVEKLNSRTFNHAPLVSLYEFCFNRNGQMKKSIYAIILGLFILISFSGQAQNLVFSKAILVSTTDTVPNGKIWKVESVLSASALNINTGTGSAQYAATNILVDGLSVFIKSSWGNSYSSSSVVCTDLPIWLPAGTSLAAAGNVYKISVLEFSIVP